MWFDEDALVDQDEMQARGFCDYDQDGFGRTGTFFGKYPKSDLLTFTVLR
jgi:hypothetical protein